METQWTTHKRWIFFLVLLVLPSISLAEDWTQIIKLLAADRNELARFGWSVSMFGDYAIIGAIFDSSYTGAAYIFVRSGNSWIQQQKLIASDADSAELFGHSVCISGEYAIVGAIYDSHNASHGDSIYGAGSAYIFKRNGSTWTQQQKLVASDRHKNDLFGSSVSIFGDYAIVGSPYHISDTTSVAFREAGASYIFMQTDTGWIQKQKLVSSPRQTGALFGNSVSISGDNLIIGAWKEDKNPNFSDSLGTGAAYIFKLIDSTWTQSQKLVIPDIHRNDYLGTSVFISGDYIIVGSPYHDYDTSNVFTNGAGAAYIFTRVNTSWVIQQKIFDPTRYLGHHFGNSVSLSGDYAIAGTQGSNYAYMFARSDSTWIFEKKLMASDHANTAAFGWAVSVSGEYSIVGAYSEWRDTSGGNILPDAGAAYIYEHTSGTDVGPTDIGETPSIFSLEQNYPNPFNPSTKIRFTIPQDERRETKNVSLKVYDILGKEVATLVNEEKPAGEYEIKFNTSSINHYPSSGVYFYQLKAGDFIQTKKMVLLK